MMNVLIVANTPADSCLQLRQAIEQGAEQGNIKIHVKQPLDVSVDDVLQCDGIIIGTTENFGYMSGQIKDFFERIYYPCLELKQGLPTALYIKAGNDGTGALNSVERILLGLKWKVVLPALIIKGNITDKHLNYCNELAQSFCAGVDMGIF